VSVSVLPDATTPDTVVAIPSLNSFAPTMSSRKGSAGESICG
jgi:hypothetical protein